MSLNESIVEEAALEWFGELGYAVGHGPHLAPGEPAAEREKDGNVEHRTTNIEHRSEERGRGK
jgi:type I restriction enzyme R subunit